MLAFHLVNPHFDMRLVLLPFFLLLALSLQAQFGVQLSSVFNSASDEFVTGLGEIEGPDFEVGGELAINYWFRLPKQRVEFLPTIRFASSKVEMESTSLQEYGADLKVNIYPFDFLGDCDCPTFGKQGPQLQKGFFLQVSGGYSFYDLNSSDVIELTNEGNGNGFTYGGALGLDIGLSNLITLTPIVGIRKGASAYREFIYTTATNPEGVEYSPKLTTLHAGLQVSFRLDHKKY